ncbi:ribonuclease MC-like [Tripterygium wilfordii]|uniref:ribonuclease MC-like n=1 Tax=Tripterygium wilfordii TaxID=458696 RepID=UPI0018F84236|nr:ribonuclease MC-like [Tripterygium wilfordii]
MAIQFSKSNMMIVAICIFIVSALDVEAESRNSGVFQYYKISLRWPRSYCNTDHAGNCQGPFLRNFTIHGLWPMYFADTRVPSYNRSGCTKFEPVPSANITRQLLSPILNDMVRYWPSLPSYDNITASEEFWKLQWEGHGMCSQYPQYPIRYFKTALNFIKHNNLLTILKRGKIYSNNEYYTRIEISRVLRDFFGARVEIRCSVSRQDALQLSEIRVCIEKWGDPLDCNREFSGCPENEFIQFPSAN